MTLDVSKGKLLYVRDPGIQEILLVESRIWEVLLVESGIPGIQLKESGILLMIGVWNLVPRIWNPGVESRIQDCLGFPYMRQGK